MQVSIARQLNLQPTTVGNFFMNARRRLQDKWKDSDHDNADINYNEDEEEDAEDDQHFLASGEVDDVIDIHPTTTQCDEYSNHDRSHHALNLNPDLLAGIPPELFLQHHQHLSIAPSVASESQHIMDSVNNGQLHSGNSHGECPPSIIVDMPRTHSNANIIANHMVSSSATSSNSPSLNDQIVPHMNTHRPHRHELPPQIMESHDNISKSSLISSHIVGRCGSINNPSPNPSVPELATNISSHASSAALDTNQHHQHHQSVYSLTSL